MTRDNFMIRVSALRDISKKHCGFTNIILLSFYPHMRLDLISKNAGAYIAASFPFNCYTTYINIIS